MSEGLFEYFGNISEPLLLRDIHSHNRSMGLPEFRPPVPFGPVLTFLVTPVRHIGGSLGDIYLGNKWGGREHTEDDEFTLVMFASQAALVVGKLRNYRDDQRAMTRFETLINTTPKRAS